MIIDSYNWILRRRFVSDGELKIHGTIHLFTCFLIEVIVIKVSHTRINLGDCVKKMALYQNIRIIFWYSFKTEILLFK